MFGLDLDNSRKGKNFAADKKREKAPKTKS